MGGRPNKPSKMPGRYREPLSCLSWLTAPQHVADLVGAETKDIVFTSGATETNNMAIKGVARFHKEKKKHIITTQTVGSDYSSTRPFGNSHTRSTNVFSTLVESLGRKDSTLHIFLYRPMASSLWKASRTLYGRTHRSFQ
jgi:Aminotransferase class-V